MENLTCRKPRVLVVNTRLTSPGLLTDTDFVLELVEEKKKQLMLKTATNTNDLF